VAQVYIEYPSLGRMPIKELKAFKRLNVLKGKERIAEFSIPSKELQKWDLQQHDWKLYPGEYFLCIGKSSSEIILKKKLTVK